MFSLKLKPKNKEVKRTVAANPKVLEVNLIKKDNSVSFNFTKNLSTLFLAFFVAVLLVIEIYFGLDWWQNKETAKTQDTVAEISALNQEITVLNNSTDEAYKYKENVVVLSDLLNNHVYWSNFLNWLEKNTLSSVEYESLNGDLSGVYAFAAIAKTYADVSWQTKAFLDDPLTKSATVDMASAVKSKDKTTEKSNQVNFTLSLEVNPAIFKK